LSDKSRTPLDIRRRVLRQRQAPLARQPVIGRIWFPSTSLALFFFLIPPEVRVRGASTAATVSATKKWQRAARGEQDVCNDVTDDHDEGVAWMRISD